MISIGDAILKMGIDSGGLQKGMGEAETSVKSGVERMQGQLRALGTAFTAIGAAGLKMVDSAREINAHLATTAITVGSTTKEMRDMVLETANVTFGIQSVADTFDILARAGVRGKEDMKAAANAFDALGDATFSSAEAVADLLIPAFKNLGVSIPRTADELDSFTWLVKNTTVELSDFSSAMQYVAAYGGDLNLTIEDMVAIMAALEAKGITGSAVTRVFRTAISQAADGAVTLNDALGLSQDEIDGFKTKLNDATGITKEYADAANTQYGIMDKLRFMWSKITFALGSVLTPLEPLFAVMTAMGPVMMFLSTSIGRSAIAWLAHAGAVLKSHINSALHIGSTTTLTGALNAEAGAAVNATGAQIGLNRAMMANPIIAIIAAIAGLVTMIVLMWKNWETVSMQMEAGWLRLKQIIGLGTPTTQAQLDALKLEATWIGVRKTVQDNYEQMVSDVEMATDRMISDIEFAAKEEKRVLDERAQYYRDKHYEKMELIDEEMMAELRAMDPVLAAQVEAYNAEIETIKGRGEARDKELEDDRLRALEKQLKDDELSKEEKRRIEDEIGDIEDAREIERVMEERNLALSTANYEDYFKGQKALVDTNAQVQIDAQKGVFEEFSKMRVDDLGDLSGYVAKYNEILKGAGFKPTVKGLELPEGAPPASTRKNKPSPADVIAWFRNLVGMQHGGWITEPSMLYGMRSGKFYGTVAETRPEYVSPQGGGHFEFHAHFHNPVIREEKDLRKLSSQVAVELERLYTSKARRLGL